MSEVGAEVVREQLAALLREAVQGPPGNSSWFHLGAIRQKLAILERS